MKANMKAVMGAGTRAGKAVTSPITEFGRLVGSPHPTCCGAGGSASASSGSGYLLTPSAAASYRRLLPDLVPDPRGKLSSSSDRPDLQSSNLPVPPRLERRPSSQLWWGRAQEESMWGACWRFADKKAAENQVTSYKFRLYFRLLVWLILSVTNLVAGIIIPYRFTIILACCCLAVSSYIAAAAIYQKSDDMNRVVFASLPVCIVILINYISLAELVDIDLGNARNDSALENLIEDHPQDLVACRVAMFSDLGLIGCALFVAEACFGLWREFNGEDPTGPPRILDLPVFNARYERERRSSNSWDRASFEEYAKTQGEFRHDDVDIMSVNMSATRASDLH
jgi:hypothetical protein